ncbi:universal stress protein [Amylibacter ulvae]|uniref:Universal stress protein n=1 Tax=Paramylibacter ulvae TaxID=1651968 RepID=A0ABQ3D273_9RHOB|nr:universal stress protein [Amylibacter ulvae]GHA49741.1 universal stress protein [Amylibacter ulvae]
MYDHILIPVIFDDGHDTAKSFEVAKTLGSKAAKYTILHVLENIPNYVNVEIPASTLAEARKYALDSLNDIAKAIPSAKAELIDGYSGRSIVNYADDNHVDCIVMASHQLGLSDIFLGSTAAKVVRHAKCSVHVIR